MIYKIVFIALVVIIAILIIRFILKNYNFKYDNFTFFEGSLGSGKTTIITSESLKVWKKRKLYNMFVANRFVEILLSILIFFIPIFNIIWLIYCFRYIVKNKRIWYLKIDKRGVDVYSNYPLRFRLFFWNKWEYSIIIDRHLFDWLVKCNEDCIIALDELGYWFPPSTNEKGNAIMTDKQETFGLTWLRHAISPCVFSASQSIDEVNITFRRKIQHIYRLSNNKRVFLRLSKVNCLEIQRSEDCGSIITTFNDSEKTHIDNWHYYIYPIYNFQSRYGRFLYDLETNELRKVAYNYEELLKKYNLQVGNRWTDLYIR